MDILFTEVLSRYRAVCIKILCGYSTELLYSYQRALPKLPLPNLTSTITRYLASVKPLLSDTEYEGS